MQVTLKKGARVAGTIAVLKNPITWIVAGILLLLTSIFGLALFISISLGGDSTFDSGMTGEGAGGTAQVSAEVLRYEPLIRKYAEENGVGEYVGLIMALIQQESGSRHLDVMQSSESIGLPPGAITDPELSIKIGVKYFAEVMKKAKGDPKLALQSYNMGSGFIPFALEHGGYSKEVAIEFSNMMAAKKTDALEVNRKFLEKFFTYQKTAERYENIKTLMTDQGFKATHPSGTELPKSKRSVKSSMVGLKPFEYQSSKTEAEFFNEFKLTTEFNNVSNTETVIVKTSLIYVKDQGWKINDVEFVGQLTGRE